MMKRRQILLGGLGFGLIAATAPVTLRSLRAEGEASAETASGAELQPDPATGLFADDRTLGDPAAPVTMIEYASLSCPHCASFHQTILPKLKSEWIETGKLYYVYRDFPLNAPALWAAMVANCLEGDRYFAFLNLLYENQSSWLGAEDPAAALFEYAQLAGFSRERFDSCVNDEAELNRIIARIEHAQATYDVSSTPTVILNGEKVQPGSYDELAEMIGELQG